VAAEWPSSSAPRRPGTDSSSRPATLSSTAERSASSLSGKLTYLSSDTLAEQGANGQVSAYYRAQVRLDPEQARAQPSPKLADMALKPGMTATVDIRTGQRWLLKYLAKPGYEALAGALNER
jgi:membrane fusion protein, adhesin transport system